MKTHIASSWNAAAAFVLLLGLSARLSPAQPANNQFASRVFLSGTNVVVTGSNVGATKEPDEPAHAGNSGGASVWWSWTAPSAGTVTISTAGSGIDTILGVYSGSSVSALTQLASNDDDPDISGYTSKVVFDVAANQVCQIAVDGYGGEVGSVRLSVQMGPSVPPPPAPAWALPDPYGQMIYSSNYAGKVIVLDFWATWCGPCKVEMPDFVAMQTKYRADGLVFIGADTGWSGDTPAVVQAFLASWTPTINYQIVMASSGMMSAYGGISGIPTTFIIDRQNLIRKKFVGSQSRATFEQAIIPLLYGNTRLTSQSSGNQITLRWPTNAVGFTLQYSTNPASTSWSNWSTPPTVVNGVNTTQVPTTGAPRYFRLRMTY